MIFDWFETICTFNYHVTPSYSSAISLKLKAWDMIKFVNLAEKIKTTPSDDVASGPVFFFIITVRSGLR